LFWRFLRDTPVARQWETQPELERKGALARAVNELNRIRNGGPIICEACNFADDRTTPCSSISFAVLCPTCHTWAHSKGDDPLQPLSLESHAYVSSRYTRRPIDQHELFGFLTTEANAIVAPIHPKPIRETSQIEYRHG
jgi:hypothetical protein